MELDAQYGQVVRMCGTATVRRFAGLILTLVLLANASGSVAGTSYGYCIDDENLNRVIAGFNRDWILRAERSARDAGYETYRISWYEISIATDKLSPEKLLAWVNKKVEFWGGSASDQSLRDRALVRLISPTGYPVGCAKGDFGEKPAFLP